MSHVLPKFTWTSDVARVPVRIYTTKCNRAASSSLVATVTLHRWLYHRGIFSSSTIYTRTHTCHGFFLSHRAVTRYGCQPVPSSRHRYQTAVNSSTTIDDQRSTGNSTLENSNFLIARDSLRYSTIGNNSQSYNSKRFHNNISFQHIKFKKEKQSQKI